MPDKLTRMLALVESAKHQHGTIHMLETHCCFTNSFVEENGEMAFWFDYDKGGTRNTGMVREREVV